MYSGIEDQSKETGRGPKRHSNTEENRSKWVPRESFNVTDISQKLQTQTEESGNRTDI